MAQSLSQLWIHIIFSTKNRYPFLKEPIIRQRMHDYIKSICYQQDCKTIVVGGIEDHVHILTKLNKNISLSDLIKNIKKSSSKWIKTLAISDDQLNQFYWQNGYGVFSVSQSKIETVKLYIENQEEHHRKQNFQDEMRKFLVQHQVVYNEEYIWD